MQSKTLQQPLVGVVGGMGPLASTAFLETLYEFTLEGTEQGASRIILYSDPAIPDRTEAFLHNAEAQVLEPFLHIMRALHMMCIQKIIVCCITLHYLFPKLPPELRASLISLVDTIFVDLQRRKQGEKHLLLCTKGTLQLGIFQQHPCWSSCAPSILIPTEGDQRVIHDMIYRLKQRQDAHGAWSFVEELLRKYNVTSFIAGCTEIHLLSRYLIHKKSHRDAQDTHYRHVQYTFIDPLVILAKQFAEEHL